jgi:hypothetical protein
MSLLIDKIISRVSNFEGSARKLLRPTPGKNSLKKRFVNTKNPTVVEMK